MKILVLSPLFPPDTGEPAEYAKELVRRLSHDHSVTALIYGHLPESVTNVSIIATDKRWGILRRLVSYTIMLLGQSRSADLIIINNAPSTELPSLLMSFVHPRVPLILCESDPRAHAAAKTGLYKFLHRFLSRRVKTIITIPTLEEYKHPEILPFTDVSPSVLESREQWWTQHCIQLLTP